MSNLKSKIKRKMVGKTVVVTVEIGKASDEEERKEENN